MQYQHIPAKQCSKCGYRHPKSNCPASGKQSYNYSGIGHFTSLCKKPRNSRHPLYSQQQSRTWQRRSNSHSCGSKLPSQSKQSHRSIGRSPSYTHNQNRSGRSPTPFRHKISHISLSSSHPNEAKGRLLTDTASDGQTTFHTTLQIITKQGIKPITVKVDPCADVNTISLSSYTKSSGRTLPR